MQPRNVQTQSQSDWKVHLLVFFDLLVLINGWKMKLPLITRPIFRCKQVNVRECRLTISLLCFHHPYHQPTTFLQKNSILKPQATYFEILNPGHGCHGNWNRMGDGCMFFFPGKTNIRQTLKKIFIWWRKQLRWKIQNFLQYLIPYNIY